MVGMCLVNMVGGFELACPYILRHHHDYCSYADTIMPQFLFASGFAMRLSLGRRIEKGGKMPWGRAIRRVLGLALVAILWYGFDDIDSIVKHFKSAQESGTVIYPFLYGLFKRHFFQTLMHIALTSLWILPVILMSWRVRLAYAVFSGLLHVVLSYLFNYAWVYSNPVGIDGGPVGILTWAVPALAGTIACDAVKAWGTGATFRLAASGCLVMLLGWAMTIPTTMYNVHPETKPPASSAQGQVPPEKADSQTQTPATVIAGTDLASSANADEVKPDQPVPTEATPTEPAAPAAETEKPAPAAAPAKPPLPPLIETPLDPNKYAPDPVLPTWERIQKWDKTLVEPPFVPPPKLEFRKWNYWMMSQRGGTLSYPTFCAGLSLFVYAIFLWVCDGLGLRLGVFRTIGTNSLAAYMLSSIASWIPLPAMVGGEFVFRTIPELLPSKTSLLPGMLLSFGLRFLFVYAVCRFLEWRKWYLRV